MPLLRVLQHIRSYECVDPRDKVFASLGIAVNVTEVDILLDYSKPVGAIYISVARYLLSLFSGYELDFFGHVERRPGSGHLAVILLSESFPNQAETWAVR